MQPGKNQGAINTIIKAGLIAGTLDLLAAFLTVYIKTGKNPMFILNYIASAALGSQALSGGAGVMLAGLLFHYMIAFLFTVLFFFLYPKIPLLSANFVISGLLYGIVVWAIMNLLVLPLTHVHPQVLSPQKAIVPILTLMFCIGLPIAWITSRYYRTGN